MLKNEEKSMFLDVDEAPDLRLGAYKSAATLLLCYANGQVRPFVVSLGHQILVILLFYPFVTVLIINRLNKTEGTCVL
ncbi:hypothetical protein WN944_012938 [Citrus x changshan-huyou]|uniref:Uncharacterized protein n=1 Tax=Citrus x changshan-huyou TaxID=2935761 RepID=A0AAP0M7P8_9ROSI